MATPQPDPVDKRLPSIMHYFSQVGNSSAFYHFLSRKSPLSSTSITPLPPPGEGAAQTDRELERYSDDGNSGDMLGLGHTVEQDETYIPPTPPHPSDTAGGSIEELQAEMKPPTLYPNTLPTPPCSSAPSPSQKGTAETKPGVSLPIDKVVTPICSALVNYHIQLSSGNPESFSRYPASVPVSRISDDPVLASHFSNPSIPDSSELPFLPAIPLLDHEESLPSKSSENLTKLTGGSCPKNTPPLTPRAMSNENPPSERTLDNSVPPSSDNRIKISNNTSDELTGRLNAAFPTPASSSSTGPAVASLKGKLFVRISEARGLRPSLDPYVVCVFEWNEYISKGAQSEGKRQRSQRNGSENDTGRPMAIPMRSRQSSHNSQLDVLDHHKNRIPVTDPQWNHEAIL